MDECEYYIFVPFRYTQLFLNVICVFQFPKSVNAQIKLKKQG